jgi:hypothetical protein
VQQVESVVDAEFQPVQALRVAAKIWRRLYVVPGLVAVTVPDFAQLLRSLVTPRQPFPQLAFSGVAVAVHLVGAAAVVGIFVPQVVAEQGRMVAVVLH